MTPSEPPPARPPYRRPPIVTPAMRLSFRAMLGWVLALGLLVGVVGAWPTWLLAGHEGLTGELVAAGVVLPAVLLSGLIVLAVAAFGPALAASTFVAVLVVRLVAVLTAGLVLTRLCRLHLPSLWVWIVVFYLAAVLAEGLWLARALKRDAFLVALGRIVHSSPRPSDPPNEPRS